MCEFHPCFIVILENTLVPLKPKQIWDKFNLNFFQFQYLMPENIKHILNSVAVPEFRPSNKVPVLFV